MFPEPRMKTPTASFSDEAVPEALSAWLSGLDLAPPSTPFSQAANHGVSLCKLFCQFAPNHLSSRDFFVPSNSSATYVIRQGHRNIRRLAGALADWFHLRERSTSPSSEDTSSAPLPAPPISLTTSAANALLRAANAFIVEQSEGDDNLITVGKALLCAAVYCDRKFIYIQAILRLPHGHQSALAAIIREVKGGTREEFASNPVKTITGNSDAIHSTKQPATSQNLHPNEIIPTAANSKFEHEFLITEAEDLKRKSFAAEKESTFYKNQVDAFRDYLEEAEDKIKGLRAKIEKNDSKLEAKAKVLSDAQKELRNVSTSAEEIDALKKKVASVAQLEERLRSISKRLKEVADVRRQYNELEKQLDSYQKNDTKISNQAKHLEIQLKSSNNRAQRLFGVTDDVCSTLENRDTKISFLRNEIRLLKVKLEEKNNQLASIILKSDSVPGANNITSEHTASSSNGELSSQRSPTVGCPDNERRYRHNGEGKSSESAIMVENCSGTRDIRKAAVRNQIYEELGILMSWDDVLDCIRIGKNRHRTGYQDHGSFSNKQNDKVKKDQKCVANSYKDFSHSTRGGKKVRCDIFSGNHRRTGVNLSTGISCHDSITSNVSKGRSFGSGLLDPVHQIFYNAQTRALLRQARDEFHSLQAAIDALRAERQASALFGMAIQQLSNERREMDAMHTIAAKKEEEVNELRREHDILKQEFDSMVTEKKNSEEWESVVSEEKERVVLTLQKSLRSTEKELQDVKKDTERMREKVGALGEVQICTKEMLHRAEVKLKEHELEAARLSTRNQSNNLMKIKMTEALSESDSLLSQISRERGHCAQKMEQEAKDEKSLAEQARIEAERLAATHESALDNLKATVAEANMSYTNNERRDTTKRPSRRFGSLRRILSRDSITASHSTNTAEVRVMTMEEFEKTI